MLLDAAVLAIIVGLIAGGRVSRLKDLNLQGAWLFIMAAVTHIALMALAARQAAIPQGLSRGLYLASFGLVLVGLWKNRRLPGIRLVGAGVLLNSLVIAANGGSMPVDRQLAVRAGNTRLVRLLDSPTYTNHTPATESTRLRFLADVLPLPLLVPRPRFFSPGSAGDVLVTAGACWLILAGMGAVPRPAGPRETVEAGSGPRGET